MKVWNSPPGWPTPPEGWTPPTGWSPDPSWARAPEGWRFWTEGASVIESNVPVATASSVKEFTARFRPKTWAIGGVGLVAAVALVIAALVLSGGKSFAQRDPSGYRACRYLAQARDPSVPEEVRAADIIGREGKAAHAAKTAAIKVTAHPLMSAEELSTLSPEEQSSVLASTYLVDSDALGAACSAQGVKLPPPLPTSAS